MAKYIHDNALDALLRYVKSNAAVMYVCTSQPASVSAARTASLASVAIDHTDFTLANGDASGRKLTVAQQSDISITYSGTANHVAIGSATLVLLVTTCTDQSLTSGGTVTVPSFKDEVADPT